MNVRTVAVVGGTHGNEYTGPFLLKLLAHEPRMADYSTFDVTLLLSNPKAYERNVRFVDSDLNRSFLTEDLADATLGSYEANRAKVLNQLLGPKGDSKTDLIIDLHTSTANMGTSVVLLDDNRYNLRLASYLKGRIPGVVVYYIAAEAYTGRSDQPFLNSVAGLGFALELGPIPNGVVRYDILMQARDVVLACLEYVEAANTGADVRVDDELEVFEHVKTVPFPLDSEGAICAVVHTAIQGADYQPLAKGTPIFQKLDGGVVLNREEEVFFPVFINEAAYYDSKIAFSLTRKTVVRIAE